MKIAPRTDWPEIWRKNQKFVHETKNMRMKIGRWTIDQKFVHKTKNLCMKIWQRAVNQKFVHKITARNKRRKIWTGNLIVGQWTRNLCKKFERRSENVIGKTMTRNLRIKPERRSKNRSGKAVMNNLWIKSECGSWNPGSKTLAEKYIGICQSKRGLLFEAEEMGTRMDAECDSRIKRGFWFSFY